MKELISVKLEEHLSLNKQLFNKHFSMTASNKVLLKYRIQIMQTQPKAGIILETLINSKKLLPIFFFTFYVFPLMQTTYNCVDKLLLYFWLLRTNTIS